jgi:hypothetical protein
MPKKPKVAEYQLDVDRVLESGRVAREGKITVVLGGGQRSASPPVRATGRASSRGWHLGRLAADGREAGAEIGPSWCGMPKKGPRTGARGRAECGANRSAWFQGIGARLPSRRPSQLQRKGPHATAGELRQPRPTKYSSSGPAPPRLGSRKSLKPLRQPDL